MVIYAGTSPGGGEADPGGHGAGGGLKAGLCLQCWRNMCASLFSGRAENRDFLSEAQGEN